ncbi:MAG: hypothetical protein WAM82_14965 [Thermoanaerobaculia bacterium]
MAKNPVNLTPEVQRFKAEFLAERSRQRAAMFESAGFPAPMPLESPLPLPQAPPVLLPSLTDEDMLAGQILARVNGGLPTTVDERLYIRRKLFAVPAADQYVPAPIRALPSKDKLLLDARLMTIDRAARSSP